MEVEDIVEIELNPEFCCESCGEVIHNHFNCAICKNDYAPSNWSSCISLYNYEIDVFKCEDCGTEYKFIDKPDYSCENIKVKIIKIGNRS